MNSKTFNEFFCLQCTPIDNESKCSTQPSFVTTDRLASIVFNNQEILKIIRVLDGNKSDGNNTTMTKICDPFLLRPLSIIYSNCRDTGIFLLFGRNPVSYLFIKNDNQLINNYHPVFPLPTFKMSERILFNNVYKHPDNQNLLNSNQSCFRTNDSCVYQLLTIFFHLSIITQL